MAYRTYIFMLHFNYKFYVIFRLKMNNTSSYQDFNNASAPINNYLGSTNPNVSSESKEEISLKTINISNTPTCENVYSIDGNLSNSVPTNICTSPNKNTQNNIPKRIPTQRKQRKIFTHQQIMVMKSVFHSKHFLSKEERENLAKSLGISCEEVKVWFQNFRNKLKKQGVLKRGVITNGVMKNNGNTVNQNMIMYDSNFQVKIFNYRMLK